MSTTLKTLAAAALIAAGSLLTPAVAFAQPDEPAPEPAPSTGGGNMGAYPVWRSYHCPGDNKPHSAFISGGAPVNLADYCPATTDEEG